MKKKFALPALLTLVSSSLVGTIAATIAWFSNKVSVTTEDNLTGSSDGAYFAYGTGTATDNPDTLIKEGPYGIETPRQLYNLAWLQYLGYFNKPEGGTITPVYFELNADIDMTGWILPPIGTTLYPFIGEFNGQGHTITNLTISNNYQEIRNTNKMPSKIRRDGSISDVNIVGMFGVIGELDNNITATYDTNVTSVKDFTIAGATIKNSLSNTLAGIAAGYVNGPLENVAITSEGTTASNITTSNASNLSSLYSRFTNISEYGVVGYCEEDYLGEVKNTVAETYNATSTTYDYIAKDKGDDNGWGGSIDMKTTYDAIYGAWSTLNTSNAIDYDNPREGGVYQYPTTRTIVENESGEVVTDEYGGYTNYSFTNVDATGYYYTKTYKNDSDQVTSQYTLATRQGVDRFMYLYGSNDVMARTNGVAVNRTYYDNVPNCFTISYSGHYLTLNGNATTDTTSSDDATAWAVDDSGHIYTVVNTTDYRYLTANLDTIGVTNTVANATVWSIDRNNGSIAYVNGTSSYYMFYDDGWTLMQTTTPYYTFYSNNRYLYYNNSYTLSSSTSADSAGTHWYFDGEKYYPANSSNAYLVYYSNRNRFIAYEEGESYYTYNETDRFLETTYGGSTYYAYYNGSSWTTSTTKPSNTYRFTRNQVGSSSYNGLTFTAKEGPKARIVDNNQTENSYFHTQPTYFPLRQITEEVETSNVLGYKIYYTNNGTNYYMVFDRSATYGLSATTDAEEATIWTRNGNNYLSPLGYATYYISYNNNNIGCTTSTNNRYTYNNNRLYSGTRYVYYNGTNWARGASGTQYTMPNQTIYQKESTITGKPQDTNTGYIVGGANNTNYQGNIRVSQYYGIDGAYDCSLQGVSTSSGSVSIDTIYTIKNDNLSSTTITDETQYNNLTAAKASLEGVLATDTEWVYGLHFMESEIEFGRTYDTDGVTLLKDKSASAFAESATINGTTYTNYELPVNCIDFNLKEKGYINFLAGAYFSGNNTFFTIGEVQRNASQEIVNVRNIAAIYGSSSEANSYVYEYTTYDNNTANKRYSVPFKFSNGQKVTLNDGVYTPYSSSASLPSGYTKLFNCRWIDSKATLQSTTSGNTTRGYTYFFELPMNDGEYCMGAPSFSGASGAYLMYLDIGANAKKVYRSELIEYFKWIDKVYSYPKGVFVMAAGTTNASDQNSYCIRLGDSYNGTLKMERTGNAENDEAKYTGTGDASKEAVSYKYPILTLKDENNNTVSMDSITPTSTTTTEVKRLSYFDFNMNDNSTTKIIVTDTYVGGSLTDRTVEKYKNFNIETNTGTEDSSIAIYYVTGDVVTNVTDSTDDIEFDVDDNDTKLLSFDIAYPNGATITIDIMLKVKATENEGHYEYTPTGFDYTITLTRADGTTEEITAKCIVTFYKNTDGTYTYTFKINDDTITGTTTTPIVITVPAVTQG